MKILSLLLSVMMVLVPITSLAQEGENNFLITNLSKGDRAPFEGILLTQESLAKIEADLKLKTRLCENDCKLEIEKMQLLHLRDLNLLTSEVHGLNKILATKNSRIEELERIVEDANDSWAVPVVGIASFILGVTITVGITYAVNK